MRDPIHAAACMLCSCLVVVLFGCGRSEPMDDGGADPAGAGDPGGGGASIEGGGGDTAGGGTTNTGAGARGSAEAEAEADWGARVARSRRAGAMGSSTSGKPVTVTR